MENVKQEKSWSSLDSLILLLMGLGTILSRWPFQARLLNSFDAVNYALALEHFDIRLSQPQAPGYPLYILLGRAFNLVLHDHLAALIWVSAVFSGLAVIALYLAGREMFGRKVGLLAAVILATSPTFWFQGEIAAPYTVDFFASALVGWLCYRLAVCKSSGNALVWLSAVTVGLAGAFRPQTLVFLFPLFLYALRRRPWQVIAGAVATAGMVLGLFFTPAVMASGGPMAFVDSMRMTVPIFYSAEVLIRTTQLPRFIQNVNTILQYTFTTLGELAWPFALLGCVTRPNWQRFWRNDHLRFLALWVLPTWIVYFLIWPGNSGTILVCMAPFYLLVAVGIAWLTERPRWRGVGWASLTILLAWQIVLFTLLPQKPFGEAYRRFDNRQSVEWVVSYYRTLLDLVRQVPVEGTLVYANGFRHLQYYLPQYRTFSPPALYGRNPALVRTMASIQNGVMEYWQDVDASTLVPPGTRRIVLFDLPARVILADQTWVEEKKRDGFSIQVISLPASFRTVWTLQGLSLTERMDQTP